MENPEKLEIKTDKAEKEPHYNFPEIAEMESAMISLIEKLKDKIEKGEYNALIVDDIGGRIPALVLRKLMTEKGSYNKENKLNTFFVTGGARLFTDDYDAVETRQKVTKFLEEKQKNIKKALIVTEYIEQGRTLNALSKSLEDAGISKFDWASVYLNKAYSGTGSDHNIFCGDFIDNPPAIYEVARNLVGLKKSDEAHSRSKIMWLLNFLQIIDSDDPDREKYEKLVPQVRKNIQQAREDINTMAQRVLEKVW